MTIPSATLFLPPMRSLILLVMVISMSTLALPQTLPAPQAITDPKQITSKPNANVEQNQQSLSIERLYMTRSVGAPPGRRTARASPSSRISAAATISGWSPPKADGPRNSPSAISARPSPRGRPTANGSPTSPTTTATNSGTFSSSRPRPDRSSTSPTPARSRKRVRHGHPTAAISPTW